MVISVANRECDRVFVVDKLVDADEACLTIFRGDLDFVVPDVYESLDVLDLPVTVFDCGTWWRITVVVLRWHAADCTLEHCSDLGSDDVNDCVDHTLLVSELESADECAP